MQHKWCLTTEIPVCQHWKYHSSMLSHQYEHGDRCIDQPVCSHWRSGARLQHIQCVSTGALRVPHQAIVMNMATWQQTYIHQFVHSHQWLSTRLQQLQIVSTGATTVLRQAINMTMATWQQTCIPTWASYRWSRARLPQLQCVSTGATTVLRQAINMNLATWQQMYRANCVLTLMVQHMTAATPVRGHWNHHSSVPSH